MPNLQRLRTEAFLAQKGRCCYCSVPMWNASPDELKPFGLRAKTATPLRCTAEHLVAQQEGGKDVAGNIAAACWLCNTRRHKRKSPPSPRLTAPSCRIAWRRGSGTRRAWPSCASERVERNHPTDEFRHAHMLPLRLVAGAVGQVSGSPDRRQAVVPAAGNGERSSGGAQGRR